MTCQDFQEFLSAYLDRELAAPDAALMNAHAESCRRCQSERTAFLEMKNLLRDKTMPEIPADLIASIEARTLLDPSWWDTEVFRVRWLPALVGVATVAGALWLSKVQHHPRPEPVLPVAAAPQPVPAASHALLPKTESSETEKGESREN